MAIQNVYMYIYICLYKVTRKCHNRLNLSNFYVSLNWINIPGKFTEKMVSRII